MRLKWPNIFALTLILVALMTVLRFSDHLRQTISTLPAIGPGYPPEDRTVGLLVLGLIGVTIVAVTRILAAGQRPDK